MAATDLQLSEFDVERAHVAGDDLDAVERLVRPLQPRQQLVDGRVELAEVEQGLLQLGL